VSATPTAPSATRAPGAEVALGKAYDLTLIRRLWTFVRPHWKLMVLNGMFIPFTIAFELAQPYLINRKGIEEHIAVGRADGLGWILLALVGLVLAQAASSFAEQWSLQLLGQRSMHGLRLAIYDHVLRQRASFFDKIPVGRLMTRMTNDVESINEMFAQGVVTLFADFIKMMWIVGIMLYLDATLTLIVFATLPLVVLLVNYARAAMRRSFRQIRVRLAAMNAFAQEHLTGVRVVQLLGRERTAAREYDEINAGHRDAYLDSIRADAAMYALVEAIGVMAVGGIAWWASGHRVQTVVTIGLVLTFISYVDKFFMPIRDLSAKYAVMQGAMAATERITQLLDTDEPDGAGAAEAALAGDDAHVRFSDVHFSYGAEPVLRGIDLAVPRGATVAVVGATGSGKSTLIKLLTRLYERERGVIRLDGVDVRALPLAELRRRITVVSQDVVLFGGTLADNITLGKPTTPARLAEVLAQVGLDKMLVRRGCDLETKVADRGCNFSAGERQLIAFARALLRDPEVLVLDEATAHVDPEAEELIERGVDALMAGRTTLVIAHRLSTIRNADLIIVMQHGRVVEHGRHDQLVAAGGLYAALERTFHRHQ
jgi:ATP-binding cassette subfamily B protein